MTPLGAVLCAMVLLLLPWLFMPRQEPGEVQGFSKRFWWWVNRFYCGFWHRLKIKNATNLPDHGPVLLISNHTCCVDHMLLQASCRRLLGFVVAKEYFDYWLFHPFCVLIGCIPVKRDGKDLAATRVALRTLGEGRVVPIFPEGQILPTSGREIGQGKQGAAFIALHARAPVVPVYIRGSPPTNQVVPSLVTPSNVTVTFGPPVDLTDLIADSGSDREKLGPITDRLMGAIRALRDRAEEDVEKNSMPNDSGSLLDGERSPKSPGALPRRIPTVVGA